MDWLISGLLSISFKYVRIEWWLDLIGGTLTIGLKPILSSFRYRFCLLCGLLWRPPAKKQKKIEIV